MEALHKLLESLQADLKGGLASVDCKLESTQASIDATAQSLHSINSWRDGVDTQVSDLTASVHDLRKQIDRMVVGVGLSALGAPPNAPGAVGQSAHPASTTPGTTLQTWNSGQGGHGSATTHRGQTEVHSLSTPVTGTKNASMAIVPVVSSSKELATAPPPPPTEFPRFDGDNP
ncbi:hypothetical protein QYE76_005095 [Lolium multiflorum]|uniref:Uncharacterized protein n=1 Tax=Lolium multiflorum TaxID=4521 RepID=A0AAD8W0E2_LOLMU|nr:hypothetical protein QYE76_005095 [Lolium multiflorum]